MKGLADTVATFGMIARRSEDEERQILNEVAAEKGKDMALVPFSQVRTRPGSPSSRLPAEASSELILF